MVNSQENNRDSLLGPFLYGFGGKEKEWVHPYFLKYEDFGVTLTRWLYEDPLGNPASWNDPSRWNMGPRIEIIKRTLDFQLGADSSGTTTTNIWGGKNAIVFSRTATVKTTVPPAAPALARVLPTEDFAYVTYSQNGDDGQQNIQTSPLVNTFGNIPGQPYIPELPEMWWGNAQKEFTVTNPMAASYITSLTWTGYVLNTGR
jgi:hypothetical protein